MISPENHSTYQSPDSPSLGLKNPNKGDLRKVDQDITIARNRLATLRQQLQK